MKSIYIYKMKSEYGEFKLVKSLLSLVVSVVAVFKAAFIYTYIYIYIYIYIFRISQSYHSWTFLLPRT